MYEYWWLGAVNATASLVYGNYRNDNDAVPFESSCSSFIRVWSDVNDGVSTVPVAIYHGGIDYRGLSAAVGLMRSAVRRAVYYRQAVLYADLCVWRGGMCDIVACCVVNRYDSGVSFMSWRDAVDMFDNELPFVYLGVPSWM